MTTPRHVRAILVVLALAVAALAIAGVGSAEAGLVKYPRPGQTIKGRHLSIVVKAGPEPMDLKARLNGVSIGRRFLVRSGERRRVLEVSPIDGLRRGKNVLRVWVLKGGEYRRATVHFKVAHRRPIASAGIDRRVVVGTRVELKGMLSLDKSDRGPRKVGWQLIKAPAKSRLTRKVGASARSTAVKPALGERRTLTPTFRPDVPGRYKVRLTAKSGKGAAGDTATIYAVPPNPLIVLKTAVPATAQDPQPGIQVGPTTLRAPYLSTAGGRGSYSGYFGAGVVYKAIFQIVAYDRVTMALKWNRTYGLCTPKGGTPEPCMVGPDGNPKMVDLSTELRELGPETLVIVSSHPSGPETLEWGAPEEASVINELVMIGIEYSNSWGSPKAGEFAGVGVPGAENAKVTVDAGQTGLDGYLTPDSNAPKHYFYVPVERVPFDTRSARSCSGTACTVTQKVGEVEFSGTIGAGQAGFLVSVYNSRTMAPVGHQTFVTASGHNEGAGGAGAVATSALAGYIESAANAQQGVVITSIHGPGQSEPVLFTPGTSAKTWEGLLEAVSHVGGTRDRFNRAAITEGSDYSLVGFSPGEGTAEAAESDSPGARLRGALVPNGESKFEPQGVTSGELPPAEMLMRIVLAPPQPTAWPLEGNAEDQAAIAAIGRQSSQLGSDPRAAYWTQLTSAESAATALEEVEESSRPESAGYSAAAFRVAQKELEKEIRLVRKTRVYMKQLAQPARSGGKVGWQEAGLISAELEERLKDLKEEGQAQAEWLSVTEEILEALSFGTELKKLETLAKFITGAAIAAETGQTIWSTNYQGGSNPPGVTVKALQLGKQLRIQAEANEASIARMGDIIVSDWSKLKVVGKYGGCNPVGGCGENGEYEELSHDEEAEQVASAATKRAADRDLYEKLVPLAYPIWNTGLANLGSETDLGEFECSDDISPFAGAPDLSSYAALWGFDPENELKTWRPYLSVARSGQAYGWLSEGLLDRMFGPVPPNDSNAESGGLGIDREAFMVQGLKINEYVPGTKCSWSSAPTSTSSQLSP